MVKKRDIILVLFLIVLLTGVILITSKFYLIGHVVYEPEPITGMFRFVVNTSATCTGYYELTSTDYTEYCSGKSEDNQVNLPLIESGIYDFIIDWGDGTNDTIISYNDSAVLHTYETSGVYDVEINGVFQGLYYYNAAINDGMKIIEIKEWGDVVFVDGDALDGMINLKAITASDVPNMSLTTSLNSFFYDCINLEYINNIENWNVSTVESLSEMFYGMKNFNLSLINNWNIDNATSLGSLFSYTENFYGDLTNWNTSSVTDISGIFAGSVNFSGNLSGWNTSSVTDMGSMFASSTNFNGNLSGWDIDNVTSLNNIFYGTFNFNGDLSDWNMNSVNSIGQLFYNSVNFHGDLSGWDTSGVTSMNIMFGGSSNFSGDLNGWNTSCVTSMNTMFQGLVNFHGDLSGWDTSGVTSMNIMFGGSSNFSGNLSDWNTSSVTSINSMFDGSSNFHGDLSGWDTSSVTSMDGLFLASSNFSGNLSDWNTSSVTSMNGLFLASSNFSGDISGWDTSSVTSMNYALSSSTNFHSDLSDWDTSGVTSMNNMFSSSTNININLSNWNTSSVTSINSMFDGSSNFHGDIGNWDTSSVTSMDGLFYNSKNFNADLRNWNFTSVNETILMFSKTTMPFDTFDKILYAINKTTIGDVNSINNLNYTSGRSAQIIQDLLNAGWNITNCNEITDEFAPSVKYSIEELGVDNYLLNIYDAWDPNLDSVWYSVDGVNHTYTSPTNVSRNVAIYANDTYGNIFSNATIICELKNIVLSITSPVDEEIYNMNIDVVVSANEEVELFYNLNENDVNISCTDDCIIDSQDLLEGNNTITIYGKDTCENIGKQTLNFVVDKSNPELFIISPRDAETYNERTQLLNLSVSDTTLDTVLFDYRGYNTTYTEPILVNFNDGLNTLKVYVNDSFGRTNYSEITLTINESLETNDESPSGSRAGGSQISEIGVPLNMSSIINITDNVGIGYIKTYNEKDMITFAYEAENYNLTVENIVPNETIDVKISSDEHSDKTKSLSSGENWNVDLDDDYIEDINVRVHSIKEKNTSIEIEDIKNETEILENETIVEYPSEVVQKESNLSWNVFLLNYPTVLLGTDWVAWGIVIISGFLIYLIIRTIKIAKIVRKEEEYYAEIRKKASSVKSKMNFKK